MDIKIRSKNIPYYNFIKDYKSVLPIWRDPRSNNHTRIQHGLTCLHELVVRCGACKLAHKCATKVVPGTSLIAPVMIIGKNPGIYEDKGGRPFVGKEGVILNNIIKAIGFARANFYITNIVKCYAGGKKLTDKEINVCRPWIYTEMTLIKPRGVVLLGGRVINSFFPEITDALKYSGKILQKGSVKYFMFVNPSYIIKHGYTKKLKKDILKMKKFIKWCYRYEIVG